LSTIAARPQRADARRNRERVLAAAAELFAENGLETQVEDIAHRAGVGVGTVYRHFATKEALIAALAEEHFERLARTAEAALVEGGDPWDVFAGAIWRGAAHAARDIAWCEIVAGHAVPEIAGQKRLVAATAQLIARAQAAGSMRKDASVLDIRTIMCGFGHVAAAQRAGAPLDWERYLTIALDGLRSR